MWIVDVLKNLQFNQFKILKQNPQLTEALGSFDQIVPLCAATQWHLHFYETFSWSLSTLGRQVTISNSGTLMPKLGQLCDELSICESKLYSNDLIKRISEQQRGNYQKQGISKDMRCQKEFLVHDYFIQ